MTYSDLKPHQKLEVLSAIKNGLYHHLRGAIYNITYMHLILDLKKQKKFSIEEIFDAVPPKNREHIDHIQPYLEMIDTEICSVQSELMKKEMSCDDE